MVATLPQQLALRTVWMLVLRTVWMLVPASATAVGWGLLLLLLLLLLRRKCTQKQRQRAPTRGCQGARGTGPRDCPHGSCHGSCHGELARLAAVLAPARAAVTLAHLHSTAGLARAAVAVLAAGVAVGATTCPQVRCDWHYSSHRRVQLLLV
jgi:hypothetical protein